MNLYLFSNSKSIYFVMPKVTVIFRLNGLLHQPYWYYELSNLQLITTQKKYFWYMIIT